MHLASRDPNTGEKIISGYDQAMQANPEIIDWVISGLPPNFVATDFKKVAQVKHIFKATIDEDNFRGTCLGTGRIQIRLSHGEDAEMVKLNFLRRGYNVQPFEQDPRKKPILT